MSAGRAVVLDRPTPQPAPPEAGGWIARLWPFLAAHKRNVVLAFGVSIAGQAVSALTPVVAKVIVDDVITTHSRPLTPWLTMLVAAGLFGFAAAYVRRFVGGRVALDVQFDLRNAVYERLQRLDFASHDKLRTGQLVSRASSDVTLLQGLLAFLPIMLGNLVLVVIALIVMVILSLPLTLVVVATLPAMAVVALRLRTTIFPASWDAQQRAGEVAGVVDEAVTGVRVVKGFGQEDRELDHLADAGADLFRARMRLIRLQARFTPTLQSVPVFGQVGVLAFGGWMAINGHITVGTLLAFASYLVQVVAPVRQFAAVMAVGQQARAGAERLLDLLDANPLVVEKPDAPDLQVTGGAVRFDDIRFGYTRDEPVLDGFTLHLAPGERVALVGTSGSGKSTVALLLPRFYDAAAGRVTIDGADVRDVTLDSLRRQVGVVFEEPFLFSDSVRANIAYGRPDATDAEVRAAAAAAEADGFIAALPDGYDSVVGERGLTLSGGQRQRVALARALITDPRILILDDATSSIDSRTEEDIYATLQSTMQGRTTILVAHRRSTLRLADRIVLVDQGRVADDGTHEELLARSPLYRALLAGPDETVDELTPDDPLLVTPVSPPRPNGHSPSAGLRHGRPHPDDDNGAGDGDVIPPSAHGGSAVGGADGSRGGRPADGGATGDDGVGTEPASPRIDAATGDGSTRDGRPARDGADDHSEGAEPPPVRIGRATDNAASRTARPASGRADHDLGEGTGPTRGSPIGAGAGATSADGGVTPEAWPYDEVDGDGDGDGTTGNCNGNGNSDGAARRLRPTAAVAVAARFGPGAGNVSGGGAGLGLAATPELLAALDKLPPADDDPDIDVAAEAAPGESFRLGGFLRPYRSWLALGFTLVAIDAVLTLLGPLMVRQGIDRGVGRLDEHALWVASAVFFLAAVGDWICTRAYTLVTGRTAERLLYALRLRVFAHLQRLSLDYYDRELAGRIMTRMTTDVEALQQLLQTGLVNAIVSLATCAGVFCFLVILSPPLALAAAGIIPPLVIATLWYRKRSGAVYNTARDRIAAVNANFQESLSGVRVAQAYTRENRNIAGFRDVNGSYLDARLGAQRLIALYFPFVLLLSDLGSAVVLGTGSALAAHGVVTPGVVIAFVLYLNMFFSPIQQLSQVLDTWQQATVSFARIDELMATPTGTPPALHPDEPGRLRGAARLDGVHFRYPNTVGDEALAGIDLDIAAGETVALVGETGAGKSTIVKLIARFYDPTQGRVTVDGHDLRDLDLGAFRRQLGVVPQEPFLFTGTIRDNIAYGRPDAGDAAVEAAARAVGAHAFVAHLPQGYLTPVSERGRSLSAGQRQLIALARAQLVDPAILLLDEATSNLDLATEAAVQQAMGIVSAGRTTILVAHRLPTAQTADRIVLVDQGRIAAIGTHDDLLLTSPHYADLWRAFDVDTAA